MLRVGFDLTVLYRARGGIHRYTANLAHALVALAATPAWDAALTFLDYAPARAPQSPLLDLAALAAPPAALATLALPATWRLRGQPWLNFRGGRRLARTFDPWLARAQRAIHGHALRQQEQRILHTLDVIHASEVYHPTPTRRTAIVATIFDLSPLRLPDHHLAKNRHLFAQKMAYLCDHAAQVIAISRASADDLCAAYPALRDRVHVVYCAADATMHPVADPTLTAAVTTRYDLPTTGYILHVGTLEPRKNLVRLLHAYAQVRATNGAHTPPLVLVGARGWQAQPIFDTVDQLRLHPHVHILGHVTDADLPALYHGATCFVYPSLMEGFGLPVLEALTCGVPVITSHTSSLPEVAGDAALFIAPTDTDALAQALDRLLHDSPLRADLIARGLRQAARFSWAATARQTAAVYQLAHAGA